MNKESLLAAEIEIEIPFYDVDPMNVVWHGHYLKYFERARCELLRRFDYDYPRMRDSGYAWPVVDCQLKFVRSARFGQRIRVAASLLEYENRLRIGYVIRDAERGEVITKGRTTQVAVHVETGELQFVSPRVLLDRVARVLA